MHAFFYKLLFKLFKKKTALSVIVYKCWIKFFSNFFFILWFKTNTDVSLKRFLEKSFQVFISFYGCKVLFYVITPLFPLVVTFFLPNWHPFLCSRLFTPFSTLFCVLFVCLKLILHWIVIHSRLFCSFFNSEIKKSLHAIMLTNSRFFSPITY